MKFLLISQRAFPNPNFRLNDLTGHGRIDVVMRCILAACRPMPNNETNTIYCYLKGSDDPEQWGWTTWEESIENHDETSFAAVVKEKWDDLFQIGTIEDLLEEIDCLDYIYLHEDGIIIEEFNKFNDENLIILGAQKDLSDEDLKVFPSYNQLNLSNYSILASQAIVLYRQKMSKI
ncbi:MAG: hypothetical protein GPJ54_13350 [Candidatus Heimdallarchaeota archaeon]|nr:hypothetical protein [Candidatus Heimdallarchaeota archaeon]